ncbi:MAG: LysR family transcriptional regulator [Ruminococcus sp.]|nr:LysR family transcriptional regulator [Ruminococcus sp.]
MNTFQLECFLTVAETLNFAKAAEILNVTQPAVTKQIKNLENELNVRLFKRSTRSVALTIEGAMLINDAKVIIQTSTKAKNCFIDLHNESKQLSIGIRLTSHIKLLYEPLKELLAKYNKCCPKLMVDSMVQLFRALYDEQLDMIIDIENNISGYDSISFKRLFKEHIYCVCTDKYPIYNCESVTIEQIKALEQYPLLLMSAPIALKDILNFENAFIGNRTHSMVHFCSTAEEICLLAELGCGIAVMPEKIIPDSPKVKSIRIIDCADIAIGVYYKNSSSNELTKEFIYILEKHYK